jgi:molecular chaperone GrpE
MGENDASKKRQPSDELPGEDEKEGMVEAVEEEEVAEREKKKGRETVASLKKALDEERAKAQDYLTNWQRSQADFINYKRRTGQEREEMIKLSNAVLVLSLLPVLDDLERALGNVSEGLAGVTWVDGIGLIYRKLKSVLEGHGLSEIKAVGEPFDPNLHDALIQVEGDEGRVIEEVHKGYMFCDRVLRPAMVKVGKGRDSSEPVGKQE